MRAGLIDEMEIHVVPMLLGGGSRLFENVEVAPAYECVGVVSSPAAAHYAYVRSSAA